jgi:hypothetical protein
VITEKARNGGEKPKKRRLNKILARLKSVIDYINVRETTVKMMKLKD